MKKLGLLVGLVALALLVLPVAVAFADYGPHGNFTKTSDGCAACHRAHTAQASYLLVTDENSLCESCHGTASTGANTNVVDGLYSGLHDPANSATNTSIVGNGLKGGGFEHTLMNTSLSTTSVGSTATVSSHQMDTTASYMWGYGPISATANAGMADVKLECVDCHDPHGMAGAGLTIAGMTTYRILRSYPIVNGAIISATTSSTVPDEAIKNYTVPNSVSNINPQNTGTANYTETVPMGYFSRGSSYTQSFYGAATTVTGIAKLCGQCHTRHLVGTGNWSTNSGDAIYTYRHTTNTSGNNCTTCHVAHGSSATTTGFAATVDWPGATTAQPSGTTHEDSALLRIDNRGTCVQCHVPSFQGPVVASLSASTGAANINIYGLHFGPSYVSGTSLIYFSTASGTPSQTVMVNMASWSGTWSDSTITNVSTAGLTAGRTYYVRVYNGQRANREGATYLAP